MTTTTIEDRQKAWDKALAKLRSTTDEQRPQRWDEIKAAFAEYRATTREKPPAPREQGIGAGPHRAARGDAIQR